MPSRRWRLPAASARLDAELGGARGARRGAALFRIADAFLVGSRAEQVAALTECLSDIPLTRLGQTCKEPRLRIAGPDGEWIVWAPLSELKEAWQKPLRW